MRTSKSSNPPAVLSVPLPAATTLALQLRNGKWERVAAEGDAASLTVSINHFSSVTSAFLTAAEWVTAGKVPPEWEPTHRQAVEASDELTRKFYGVGELTTRTIEDRCREFKASLAPILASPGPNTMVLPPDKPNVASLASFLKHGDSPSRDAALSPDKRAVSPYYWQKTAPSMDAIAARLAARGGQSSPADLLAIAIEANGGNVPLGILAAHNFLKDAAYQGRLQGDPKPEGTWTPADATVKTVDPRFGRIAGQMQTWRTREAWSPKGRYDKLGPLYHIFATMTAAVWGGGWFGHVAENGEAFLRYFGIGSDVYDPDKGAADTCGRLTGDWINNPEPLAFFQPVDGPVSVDQATPVTLVIRGLKDQTGVTFRVVEGEAKVARTSFQASPSASGPECDRVGRELLCGNSVTPTKEGRVRLEAAYDDGLATLSLEVGGQLEAALTWTSRSTVRAGTENAGSRRSMNLAIFASTRDQYERITVPGGTTHIGYESQQNACEADPGAGDTLKVTVADMKRYDPGYTGSNYYIWARVSGICSLLGDAVAQPLITWQLNLTFPGGRTTRCSGSFVYIAPSGPSPGMEGEIAAVVSFSGSGSVTCRD